MRTETSNPTMTTEPRPDAAASHGSVDPEMHPILFFDGVCGLCNASVDWLLVRDRQGMLRFAPLQGSTAEQMLPQADSQDLNSVVLLDGTGLHRRSRAAVRALNRLGGRYRLLSWLLWMIPAPLRELGYRIIAKSRYRLFGKKETCRLPTPSERERFLP